MTRPSRSPLPRPSPLVILHFPRGLRLRLALSEVSLPGKNFGPFFFLAAVPVPLFSTGQGHARVASPPLKWLVPVPPPFFSLLTNCFFGVFLLFRGGMLMGPPDRSGFFPRDPYSSLKCRSLPQYFFFLATSSTIFLLRSWLLVLAPCLAHTVSDTIAAFRSLFRARD